MSSTASDMVFPTVRLAGADNIAVAIAQVACGDLIAPGLVARQTIPIGHKVATHAISAGEVVLKYGQIIGIATTAIQPGDHVHIQNLAIGQSDSMVPRAASGMVRTVSQRPPLSFRGFRRPDGRVGTRNQVGVIASVNCSATVVHALVDKARHLLLPRYPNVHDVVPIAHPSGCGMASDDAGFQLLRRTMRGFLGHPNFGAALVIGLGCEVMGSDHLVSDEMDPRRYRRLDIQGVGGTSATIDRGLRVLESLMGAVDSDRREEVPVSELVVGLQCGGSDGLSGVTANPAMGVAVDRLMAADATALLSETPEIVGAEHLLISRAETPEVAAALRAKIAWWQDYARQHGTKLDNNPSPGNKQGGLTTILEKSLGAVAKAGQSSLRDVIDYAQPIRSHGLVFMDSPGFDPCSATGQVASGVNLLIFSTGRGSCFGCKPVPSIKLATNSEVYLRLQDDMDIDCGRILSGTPMSAVADEIVETMLSVASGRKTKSELLGYGDHEFVPWRLGAVL